MSHVQGSSFVPVIFQVHEHQPKPQLMKSNVIFFKFSTSQKHKPEDSETGCQKKAFIMRTNMMNSSYSIGVQGNELLVKIQLSLLENGDDVA